MQGQPHDSDEPAWRLRKPPAILFSAACEVVHQFLDASGLHDVFFVHAVANLKPE